MVDEEERNPEDVEEANDDDISEDENRESIEETDVSEPEEETKEAEETENKGFEEESEGPEEVSKGSKNAKSSSEKKAHKKSKPKKAKEVKEVAAHTVHKKKERAVEDEDNTCCAGGNPWKIAAVVLAIALIACFLTGFSIKSITGGSSASASGEFTLTVINDKNCAECDASQITGAITSQILPGAKVVEIEFDSSEGKKLIQKYGINMLPAYLLSTNVKDSANFEQIQGALISKEDAYLIEPSATGAAKALTPPQAGDSPSKGDKDAPVTIIEFSEFKCPYCAAVAGYNQQVIDYLKQGSPDWEPAIPKIIEEYVKTGKVRIVFKNFIVHDTAEEAGIAGLCANEQGKFWEMHNKMFANQEKLANSDLKQYADDIGLDTDKFSECLDLGKYAEKLAETTAEGRAVGISGTPGFYINDIQVTGAQPYSNFKAIIEAELKG